MNRFIVRYYSVFCIVTNFCREEELELKCECNLWNLVDILISKYGADFRKKLFDSGRNLLPSAWILVNGERIKTTQFEQRLKFGDTIVFTTPLLVGG